ncbi:cytochrome b5 [Meredithblackwellia eburnea MCA 4105]
MSEVMQFSFDELKQLNGKKNLHLLIHGKVYAIAKFMDEHPGGDEVLLGEAGRDATEAFEDVGHSDEAREILEKYFVGNGPEGVPTGPTSAKAAKAAGQAKEGGGQSFTYLYPLAGLVAYMAWKYYGSKEV